MTTAVIVLAQGKQTRLPDLKVPKQLLKLDRGSIDPLGSAPAIPIIVRTLKQLRTLRGELAELPVVVCDGDLAFYLQHEETTSPKMCRVTTLAEPGNSSLKGIARCLHLKGPEFRPLINIQQSNNPKPDHVVVLLGDVVYSWACLGWLFDTTMHGRFVTSNGLTQSEGEVWGVSWDVRKAVTMRGALIAALEKHPPFEAYQPGQLRQWFFQCRVRHPEVSEHTGWIEIPRDLDYTMDVDTPKDIPLLAKVAQRAHDEDREHGMVW